MTERFGRFEVRKSGRLWLVVDVVTNSRRYSSPVQESARMAAMDLADRDARIAYTESIYGPQS